MSPSGPVHVHLPTSSILLPQRILLMPCSICLDAKHRKLTVEKQTTPARFSTRAIFARFCWSASPLTPLFAMSFFALLDTTGIYIRCLRSRGITSKRNYFCICAEGTRHTAGQFTTGGGILGTPSFGGCVSTPSTASIPLLRRHLSVKMAEVWWPCRPPPYAF